MMSIEAEEAVLAGPQRHNGSSGMLILRTPELAAWMKHALTTHRISVKGTTGMTPTGLVKVLPSGL